MKLILALMTLTSAVPCLADPGIMIEMDIFIERPSPPQPERPEDLA